MLDQAIKTFVPLKPKIAKSRNRKKKHLPKHIRKKFALKARLWRKYRSRKTVKSKINYRKVAESCRGLLLKHQVSIENKILSANDLGKFYRYINSKLSCKSGIAPLINSNGIYIFENRSKADLLNNYFASVCVPDNGVAPVMQPALVVD